MAIGDYHNESPVCPFCESQIRTTRDMLLGANKMFYLCPKCSKVLSVGRV
ncbi:MAG TPA: hypothetical protein VI979_02085 [archaeon]|nr:hypothetical protein [archaeon]